MRILSSIIAGLWLAASPVRADNAFPEKPVKLIVPFAAGGGSDVLARALGQQLGILWKQPVVVENRPGASGVLGSRALATSPPDGYTLAIVSMSHAINPLLRADMPYDSAKDFTPVTELARSANVLAVKADSPYKSIADLLTAARLQPGALSYGNSGNATSLHLAGELFKYLNKVDIATITYKGGSPAITDLMGGHVTMTFNGTPEVMPHIKSGNLRALAVTTATRDPFLPNVPTMQEAGVKGYENAAWYGILAPGGLSKDLTRKIHEDIAAALKTQPMKDLGTSLGMQLIGSAPDQFERRVSDEARKWAPIIKAAGIKAE